MEPKVSALEEKLHKERHAFSKMGENNYKVFQVDSDSSNAVCATGDVNNDGFNAT